MLIASDIAHSGGVTFGELVQQDLAEIGIEVRLEVSEAARYRERLFANDYDLAGHGYGRASRDPAGLLGTTVAFRPDRNLSQFYVDEYAAMVGDAVTTIDPEERTQKYRELTRYIVDQAFVLTVAPAYPFAASYDWVHGVTSNLEGWYSFEKAWVDR
jgi:peptide/nickel transport system substrate-binding protein